ncbi:MAG TPA: hypothetical protein ENI32_00815 [Candidatus Syntrophoarchaeum butanivorans]|uniref:Uncharacterized protein n=2 Tax=Candidatus Syntropharchaeum TaxID=1912923 RepID=A0A1F2P722_9EURY|nr:MAG: hypothetical protein SCAL_001775 [Candidatus Syntrophoarchaeum caldarius]HEC56421.1 hypothetical protein [Candidatus Syntrophoarchaeum butanivorans]
MEVVIYMECRIDVMAAFGEDLKRLEKYRDNKKLFDEYKKMRAILGKSTTLITDTDEIKRILGGDEFISSIKRNKRK